MYYRIPADFISIVYCTAVRYSALVHNYTSRMGPSYSRKALFHHPVIRTYNYENYTSDNISALYSGEKNERTEDEENDAFEFLWRLGQESNLPQTQTLAVLKALGCTTDYNKALRYLNASLDNSFIRRQDAHLAFSGVASNSKTFLVARNFLYERIKDIYEYLGSKSNRLASYVDSVANHITNEREYEELVEFTRQNAQYLVHSQLGIKKSLESAKIMIQWQKRHYNEVISLLKEYTK